MEASENYLAKDPISNNTVKVFGIMAFVAIIPVLALVMSISHTSDVKAPNNIESSPIGVVKAKGNDTPASVESVGEPVLFDAQHNIKSVITSLTPGANVQEIDRLSHHGLYRVVVNGNVLYFTGDGEVMLSGSALNTQTGEQYTPGFNQPVAAPASKATNTGIDEEIQLDVLSEQAVSDAGVMSDSTKSYEPFPQDISIATGDVGAPIQVAVFTDPDCPFCRQLEKVSADFDGVELANMLYPIEELHPGATEVSRKIWCSDDPQASFKSYMASGDKSVLAEVDASCQIPTKIAKAAARANVNGTPTFLSVDGRILEGYPGRDEFMKWVYNEK